MNCSLRLLALVLLLCALSLAGERVLAAAAKPETNASAAAPVPRSSSPESEDKGFSFSIQSGTQGIDGKLGIGVGYIGDGAYYDERGKRRDGLHASLSIAVEDAPALFSQPDVHEGQSLRIAGYRIRIDRILPASRGRGVVVLRVWSPPVKPKSKKKGWLGFFGL